MKNRIQVRIYLMAIMAVVLLLSGSCKKKETTNSPAPVTYGTVTDIDGNTYHSVTIGTQVWMAENLKTTKYNDGTAIPLVSAYANWRYLSTPGYCWYNNDTANKNAFGALYNWYTINTGKLAPTGWHVPTVTEWWTLINYLGGWEVAGGKMKSVGTIENGTGLWYAPNTGANNESGFSAVPTGEREEGGNFMDNLGKGADWWTATGPSTTGALDCTISYWNAAIGCGVDEMVKSCGNSVRCIKN